MIGQTLSHYKITSALGAGGMGEAYRATDTNLHRDVAIKVLPPEVVQDPERLSRFRREAHLLASLNHPNIAAIYGLEEADGKAVPRSRARPWRGPQGAPGARGDPRRRGPRDREADRGGPRGGPRQGHRPPRPQARQRQADAGRQGEGARLRPRQGLGGRRIGRNPGSAALSQSPTLAHTGTIAGVILGTAAYMSPEQARGKPVDKRADVWSFGVLVWEMLTGRSLFAGDTVTDVIASVVKEEPDLDALPEGTPRAVRRLIERCLRKDPRTRLPDIGAARLDFQDVLGGRDTQGQASSGGDSVKAAETERQGRRKERWAWAAAATLLGGVATTLALAQLREGAAAAAARGPVRRRSPGRLALPLLGLADPVTRRQPDPVPRRPPRPLRETPRARTRPRCSGRAPSRRWPRGCWPAPSASRSPSGRRTGNSSPSSPAASSGSSNLASGAIQRICAVPPGYLSGGVDWSPDGTIAFAASAGGDPRELFTVPAAGGEPRAFAPGGLFGRRSRFARSPPVPAWREACGLHRRGEGSAARLVRRSARRAQRRPTPGRRPRPRPDRGPPRSLRAGRHPGRSALRRPGRGALRGSPVVIAASVGACGGASRPRMVRRLPRGHARLHGRTEGERERSAHVARPQRQRPRDGRGAGRLHGEIVLSPDGRNVAVEIRDAKGGSDLWVVDVARGVPSRVTAGPGEETNPLRGLRTADPCSSARCTAA